MDTHTYKQKNKQACMDRNTCLRGHVHKVEWYTHIHTHAHTHIYTQRRIFTAEYEVLDKIELTPAPPEEATTCR